MLSFPCAVLNSLAHSVSLASDAWCSRVLDVQVLDTEGVEQISFAELCQELRKLVREYASA